MELCMVMTHYYRLEMLEQTIASLRDSQLPHGTKLIIVDDHSPDPAEREYVRNLRVPGIEVHSKMKPRRAGSTAHSINAGLEELDKLNLSDDCWICLLDNDVQFKPGWAQRAEWAFEEAKKAGKNPIAISCTNMPEEFCKTLKSYDGWKIKDRLFGVNWMMPQQLQLKHLPRVMGSQSWDVQTSQIFRNQDFDLIALSPSYIQHIGNDSTLKHGAGRIAEDF